VKVKTVICKPEQVEQKVNQALAYIPANQFVHDVLMTGMDGNVIMVMIVLGDIPTH